MAFCRMSEPSTYVGYLHCDPFNTNSTAKTHSRGYFESLGDAIEKALKSGRRQITKDSTVGRPVETYKNGRR